MNELSIKNQEKVLKILIDLSDKSPTPWIYRPQCFENNFKFISAESLITILDILADKEYISVQYANLPDSLNINTIQITPKGFNYHPQKALETKERWLERLFGFLCGTVLGSVVTYFIPIILSRIV